MAKGVNVNAIIARALTRTWRKRIFVYIMAALTIIMQVAYLILNQWIFPNDQLAFQNMSTLSFVFIADWVALAAALGGSMKETSMALWLTGFAVVFILWAAIEDTQLNLLIWVVVMDWVLFLLQIIAFIAVLIYYLALRRLRKLLVRFYDESPELCNKKDILLAKSMIAAGKMD
jgi:hypothetical protein